MAAAASAIATKLLQAARRHSRSNSLPLSAYPADVGNSTSSADPSNAEYRGARQGRTTQFWSQLPPIYLTSFANATFVRGDDPRLRRPWVVRSAH